MFDLFKKLVIRVKVGRGFSLNATPTESTVIFVQETETTNFVVSVEQRGFLTHIPCRFESVRPFRGANYRHGIIISGARASRFGPERARDERPDVRTAPGAGPGGRHVHGGHARTVSAIIGVGSDRRTDVHAGKRLRERRLRAGENADGDGAHT